MLILFFCLFPLSDYFLGLMAFTPVEGQADVVFAGASFALVGSQGQERVLGPVWARQSELHSPCIFIL
jgi:hypothetical protein